MTSVDDLAIPTLTPAADERNSSELLSFVGMRWVSPFCPSIDDWLAYTECEFAEAPTFINGAEYPGDGTWLEKGKYTFSNAPTFIVRERMNSLQLERKINLLQFQLGIKL